MNNRPIFDQQVLFAMQLDHDLGWECLLADVDRISRLDDDDSNSSISKLRSARLSALPAIIGVLPSSYGIHTERNLLCLAKPSSRKRLNTRRAAGRTKPELRVQRGCVRPAREQVRATPLKQSWPTPGWGIVTPGGPIATLITDGRSFQGSEHGTPRGCYALSSASYFWAFPSGTKQGVRVYYSPSLPMHFSPNIRIENFEPSIFGIGGGW